MVVTTDYQSPDCVHQPQQWWLECPV